MLGVPLSVINKTKYVLQLRAVISWVKAGARGTILLPTATGKSFVALLAIKKMHNRFGTDKTTIIIVPDSNLKEQWEGIVRSLELPNVKVYVINTVALYGYKYKCDLLVVDEVHETPSMKFRQIFTNVTYDWLMCLTATIKRLDGLEKVVMEIAPICFERTQKMAIEKGWISTPTVLNVPIFMTRDEEESLKSLSKKVGYYMKKFGDFKLMQMCISISRARDYALQRYPGDDPDEKAKEIQVWAIQGDRAVRNRKEYLYNCKHKIDATVRLLELFKVKSIVFSQSIKFADTIDSRMGDECVVYHSQIKSGKRQFKKNKSFKTESGAVNYAVKHKHNTPTKVGDEWVVEWFTSKAVTGNTISKDNILKYVNGKKRVISTARGLDKGFDCDTIMMGIDAARTRSSIAQTQRLGRIVRVFKYSDGTAKRPVFVSLYIPNTTDEDWLRKAQQDMDFQYYCEDIEEAIGIIKSVLDGQLGKV